MNMYKTFNRINMWIIHETYIKLNVNDGFNNMKVNYLINYLTS